MPPYVTNRKGAEIGEQVESMVDDDLVRRRELLATVNPPVYPQWCQSVKEQLGMRQAVCVFLSCIARPSIPPPPNRQGRARRRGTRTRTRAW